MRYLILLIAIALLSGCGTVTDNLKVAVDSVCATSPMQQAAMAEQADKSFFPHKVRVYCNGLLDGDR